MGAGRNIMRLEGVRPDRLRGTLHVDISINTATSNEIIAAPGSGLQIVVYYLQLVATSDNTVKIYSATTAKSGAMTLKEGVGFVAEMPFTPIVCAENEAFKIELTAATLVAGWAVYRIEAV